MRVLILSDIHANIDALYAVHAHVMGTEFDEIWVLGDLVDYGGAPMEVLTWVRAHATRVVRGNHDHAMGTGDDCQSAPAFHDLSVASREFFRPRLPEESRRYLAAIPLQQRVILGQDDSAHLVHATPRDPLFEYMPRGASDLEWHNAIRAADSASYVFVGHTHEQFTRRISSTTLVNPGSVGLPKDGDPRAMFAVLEGHRISLERVAYDTSKAAARLSQVPLTFDQRDRLTTLIKYGR